MSTTWKKRFWTSATVDQVPAGFGIKLDDRPLKTPAKATFQVSSRPLADAIATEWNDLEGEIDPDQLPFTKLCNAAIDNMGRKSDAVVDALTSYSETDLLCYRADTPVGLVERQSQSWDPLLDWLRATHEILMVQTNGILPVEQPAQSVDSFRSWLVKMDSFELMATHDLVMISGSIVIARAVVEGEISPPDGWRASIVDELWQIEQWGDDEEASMARDRKARDFKVAAELMRLLSYKS